MGFNSWFLHFQASEMCEKVVQCMSSLIPAVYKDLPYNLLTKHKFTFLTREIPLFMVKVKWSRYRPGVAQRVGRGITLLFHHRGTRRGECSAARPGRNLPPGKTRYPFYRRLCGPQGRSGWTENLVPTGIRFRTVQPVVIRYTDWGTRPTLLLLLLYMYNYIL